jgi:phosphatidylinositol alpha-mannosyltransferase
MAAGLPIVASDIEGYSQVLRNQHEGLLVPPRDARAVAGAICQLLQDRPLAGELGARGRLTAAQYSWPRIAEQVLDFYVKTAARSYPTYSPAAVASSGLVT